MPVKTGFHSIKIKEISKTTRDCAVVAFDIPDTLKESFQFKQGQYLTLRSKVHGEDLRRSYSLCSAPHEGVWKIAVKKIEGGRFSTYVNDTLKTGDMIDIMPPQGRFYIETDTSQNKVYVAFAAGSGITPILSIIKTHLAAESGSSFVLFYVNQTTASIILKNEIEDLKNTYFDRFQVFHFLTQEERGISNFNGRIDSEKLAFIFSKLLNANQVHDYFICGPEQMILLIQAFLLERGVHKKSIHFELFNTGVSTSTMAPKKVLVDTGEYTKLIIKEGGVYKTINLPLGSNNILDAALERQIDLPYACKGGVCCTCKAKLIKGSIDQRVSYGLEQDEIDAGYILTCTAYPLTEEVEVDFDSNS